MLLPAEESSGVFCAQLRARAGLRGSEAMAEAVVALDARVCLADESGELAAARELLSELGLAWDEFSSGREGHVDLLISTPQHALGNPVERSRLRSRAHIVIGKTLSRTLRQQLQRHSCDFVVEDPVDPAALRLLIETALYCGPERREGVRAVMGEDVKIKSGFWTKRATMLQLSARGAGLAVDQPVKQKKIQLRLPAAWTNGDKVDLNARVIGQARQADGSILMSVVFEGTDGHMRKRLLKIMKENCPGDGIFKPWASSSDSGRPAPRSSAPGSSDAEISVQTPAPAEEPMLELEDEVDTEEEDMRSRAPIAVPDDPEEDRRQAERLPFTKRVLATLRGQAQAVVSRDISEGGMRLEPDPDLSVGDELKLALYGVKGSPPLILRAVVVHDGGKRGLGLQFQNVSDKMQQRLDTLIADSPISGPADQADESSERPKMVVTDILDQTPSSD